MNGLMMITAASAFSIAACAYASARSFDTEPRGIPKGLQQAQMGGEPIGPGPPVKDISGKKSGSGVKQERGGKRR